MTPRREFFARQGFLTDSISLYLRERPGDGSTLFAAPAQMVAMSSDPRVGGSDPFVRITYDEAQRLVDELWQCGIRPSEGTGSAGSLAATERHLADIRNVAFGAIRNVGVECDGNR
jgi:hypothetical protein